MCSTIIQAMEASPSPKLVVAIDFGTTFSGFAFAHRAEPHNIYSFYQWPQTVGELYCKTPTALYYEKEQPTQDGRDSAYILRHWGWPAHVQKFLRPASASSTSSSQPQGFFITKFKLLLAAKNGESDPEEEEGQTQKRPRLDYQSGKSQSSIEQQAVVEPLPPGLSVERVVSDYLNQLSQFAVCRLRSDLGSHLSNQDIQWCLTVPAIWDERAKDTMSKCAQMAGMVTGPFCSDKESASPRPLIIVLESEGASAYCATKSKQMDLREGDAYLIADVGGGTVDLVVHAQAQVNASSTRDPAGHGDLRLRSVSQSTGDLCGGIYVDMNFNLFMASKIGPCYAAHIEQNPASFANLLRQWKEKRNGYDGSPDWPEWDVEVPRKLGAEWKSYSCRMEVDDLGVDYDQILVTGQDMKQIFDPVVDRILELIKEHLRGSSVKKLMLVGGFSASPYVAKRVREDEAIRRAVQEVITPGDPGSAVCKGAVTLGLRPGAVISRVSRKTYGYSVQSPFDSFRDPLNSRIEHHGKPFCHSRFSTMVKMGEEVALDQCVSRLCGPARRGLRRMQFEFFSADTPVVRYSTEPGVHLEGRYELDISDDPDNLDKERKILFSMYFGRSSIQVTAKRLNFGDRTEQVLQMIEFEFDSKLVG